MTVTSRASPAASGQLSKVDGPPAGRSALVSLVLLVVSTVLIMVSLVGLVLAELGAFSWLGVLIGAGGVTVLLVVWFRRSALPTCFGANWSLLEIGFLLGLSAVCLFLLYRPGESVFGGHDAGTRFNAGVELARHGGFGWLDPDVPIAVQTGSLERYLGLYLIDPSNGQTMPQFNGVYEVWIGLAYSLVGLSSARDLVPGLPSVTALPAVLTRPLVLYLSPVFAIVAAWLFYALARRMYGARVAALAVILLAVSYPQVTFARLTMSEILTQAFILLAAVGFVDFRESRNRSSGLLAGLALGCAFLTRIDSGLIYVLLAVWVGWRIANRTLLRSDLWLLAPAGLLAAQAVAHYFLLAPVYTIGTFQGILARYGIPAAIATVVLVAVGAGYLAVRNLKAARVTSAWLQQRSGTVAAIALLFWGTWALVIRPMTETPVEVYAPALEETITVHNGLNLPMLAAYLGPATLVLGILGGALSLKHRSKVALPILVVGLAYLILFSWNPFITPLQPFWVRRFLPVAIPMVVLLASWLVIGRDGVLWRFKRPIAIVASIALAVSVAIVAWPAIRVIPNYQGLLAQIGSSIEAIPPGSVLIFEQGYPGSVLAVPLSSIYGRNSFRLVTPDPDPAALAKALEVWTARDRQVFYVTDQLEPSLDSSQWAIEPQARFDYRFSQMPQLFDRIPVEPETIEMHLWAYAIRPCSPSSATTFPLKVDVGSFDCGQIGRGFYRSERESGKTFRWTDGDGVLTIPWPAQSCPVRLTVSVGSKRPEAGDETRLELRNGDRLLASTTVANVAEVSSLQFDEYVFDFSAGAVQRNSDGTADLQLRSNTWQPNPESSQLGVAVDSVTVVPGPPCQQ